MLSDSTMRFLLAMCSKPGEPSWENSRAVGFNGGILVSHVWQAGNKPGEPSWEYSHAVGFNDGILVSDL